MITQLDTCYLINPYFMNVLGLGLPELIVIALVLLLFFGTSRLPGLFRSLGSSVRELKKGLNEDMDDAEIDTSITKLKSADSKTTKNERGKQNNT